MEHVCSFDDVPQIETELRIKCSGCDYTGWFKDTEDALVGMQDHEQISRGERKRRRIAPLDRRLRDKVLELGTAEPEPLPGVLTECGCPFQHRVPKGHVKRRCFICGQRRRRATLVEDNPGAHLPGPSGEDQGGVHIHFAERGAAGVAAPAA